MVWHANSRTNFPKFGCQLVSQRFLITTYLSSSTGTIVKKKLFIFSLIVRTKLWCKTLLFRNTSFSWRALRLACKNPKPQVVMKEEETVLPLSRWIRMVRFGQGRNQHLSEPYLYLRVYLHSYPSCKPLLGSQWPSMTHSSRQLLDRRAICSGYLVLDNAFGVTIVH